MRISAAGMFGNSPNRDLGYIRAVAQAMEDLGYRALYVPEHVVFFASYDSAYPYSDDGSPTWGPDTGIYDPLFVSQVAAAATSTLRFCTGVLILPQRPALLTAKEVLTLDHLSDGRFELGVGAGWSSEEYAALGVPWARRGRRLDEYIEAIRVAWRDDRATYDGEFVSFTDVVLNPKPVTPGGPPIIVGGDSAAAMRRAARLGDGWYGWWVQDDLEAHLVPLHDALAAQGRAVTDDGFSLRLGLPFAAVTPDQLAERAARARALGVDELVLAGPVPSRSFVDVLGTWIEAVGERG